jgi:hypothetical protein
MFKKLTVLVACVLSWAPMAVAQGRPAEIFLGYTNLQGEGLPNRNNVQGLFESDFFRSRSTLHGVNASLSGFGSSGLGLTGDLSFARQKRTNDAANNSRETHTDYFMAGPAVKWNRGGDTRVEPFIRVMAGAARTRFEASQQFQSSSGTITRSFEVGATDFAAALGGGVDLRLGGNIKLRLFQVDYAPVFLRDRSIEILGGTGAIQPATLEKQRQDNVRFSFGLVF